MINTNDIRDTFTQLEQNKTIGPRVLHEVTNLCNEIDDLRTQIQILTEKEST